MADTRGRVLIIAGSDSGGGAGIQADIKAVTCLGGFAMTAITALTAQNTQGVFGIHAVPEDFVRDQIRVVMQDLGADCLKIGMLATAGIIRCVRQAIDDYAPTVPLVLDPVMVAKGGHPLLEPDAVDALKTSLAPRATVITPNLPEAGVLTGLSLSTEADMRAAVPPLRALGAQAVLLKGGHLEGDSLLDLQLMTTVAGNVSVEKTTRNALQLLHFWNADVPLAQGASMPLVRPLRDAASVHGESGMEGYEFVEHDRQAMAKPAFQAIRDALMHK